MVIEVTGIQHGSDAGPREGLRAGLRPDVGAPVVDGVARGLKSDGVTVAGDAALEVEVALGDLAAGIRLAKAEVRRLRAGAAGWAARGAWGSGHPSIPR